MWDIATDLFREYAGTGLIVILYLLALVYLWVKEKRKYVRILFLYVPVILLILYFNPLFAGLLYRLAEGEIYYRVLWLLPITVTIAFAASEIYSLLPDRRRILFGLAAAAGIVVSGSYIYNNPYFQKAENLYHVPDSVVHICDAIRVPGREVMAAFPEEMLLYVRQYSPYVCMPYGRDVIMGGYHELHQIIEADPIVLDRLVPLARQEECHYIILNREKTLEGSVEAYGWTVFMETDGYIIYRDNAVELIVPEIE